METKNLLKQHLEALKVQRQEMQDVVEPFKTQREELNKQIIDLQSQVDDLTLKISEGLGPEFLRISTEISSVAKALGAVSATEVR